MNLKKILFASLSLAVLSLFGTASASNYYLHSPSGNAQWTVMPADAVGDSQQLFTSGYSNPEAVEAVVPGTVFTSYVESGREKDPNFGDNIHNVDRSKYDRSFWYRASFTVPADFDKDFVWLNFRGINRRGDIYLNGTFLGTLDGFMQRGCFDVTKIAKRDGENILAVLVHIPALPLANQGSPNYLSSGGWDWMPYVPGLNSGITDKVYLSNTGAATIKDPWIRTKVPTRAKGELSIAAEVTNNGSEKSKVELRGVITPGNVEFSQAVELAPGETKTLNFDKRYYKQLVINNPRLWWPNGYGDPDLYTCNFELVENGKVSDTRSIDFGIKEYSYDKDGGVFHLYINGERVFVKGADWGMSEYMLRCRGEEYDTKIRLHKEMNFNMIRNWLGSVTDDEFYEYCDRYGIMVWDDFWMNSTGKLPYDLNAFNVNMIEKIKRVRNHPCLAVWCGDNEGTPEAPLTGWMAENIKTFDGGDRYFQPRSNAGGLSGSGPWGAKDQRWYFLPYPVYGLDSEMQCGWGFRTEIGTAVVPNVESLRKFMPADKMWPINDMWNLHYFGSNAGNGLPDQYAADIDNKYGKAEGVEDFCRKAQLINLESNKALYEGWLDHMWEDASGVMNWMGQSAYPSMVWQTYDYYYDLTGAYFGCKIGCEPLHIFWNPVTDEVKVANTTKNDYEGLTAEVKVYNMDGKEVESYTKVATMNSPSNTAATCFVIDFNKERDIISRGKTAVASSTSNGDASMVIDCDDNTRWSAMKADNEWIYVDLGGVMPVGGVRLNWEAAYGKEYKIQVSTDGKNWEEKFHVTDGEPGVREIIFPDVEARYVRMLGLKLGWWFGYSLWSMDVLGGVKPSQDLSDVHFIRLTLKDKDGNVVSENNYWRGNDRCDFTALNELQPANLKVSSKLVKNDGKATINATISLPSSAKSPAFAVHVQALRKSDGERLLPAIMNDNYFTLMPGEKKVISIEMDEKLLDGDSYTLSVVPYNN